MRWAGLFILMTGPAFADPALISFDFATTRITATGAGIELVEQTLDMNGNPALLVRLRPAFDALFAESTEENVGKVMTIRICGEIVVEPLLQTQLPRAEVMLTVRTAAEVNRLGGILTTKTCPDQPAG